MIKLAWRQFRSQAFVALGVLVLVAVIAVATRPHLVQLLSEASTTGPLLEGPLRVLRGAFIVVVLVAPVLVGAFWGAPLIARELETGTFRLAWTQSVTRGRWLAMKLLVVGVASVVVTGLLSLIVTWWSNPLYTIGFSGPTTPNRFDVLVFGAGALVPLAYGAFGFMVGVTSGLLFRRTLPAMGVTFAVFAAIRIAVTYWVRPYFMTPTKTTLSLTSDLVELGLMRSSATGDVHLDPFAHIPNAWVYSVDIVDQAGNPAIPEALWNVVQDGGPAGNPEAAAARLAEVYHAVVTSQPASRFWAFQGIGTAVFIALALLIAGLCFWWVRRHIA